jgi:hypothetical protein
MRVCASSFFSSLLPNPAWDDTLGEYIDIRNTGCQSIDISWYEVRDIQKWYILPGGTLIDSKENLRLEYATSKISLNNSGLETIFLKDTFWSIIDVYSYSGTQRDNIVLAIATQDEICDIPVIPEFTWSLENESGSIFTWETLIPESTWSLIDNLGAVVSWEILISTGSVDNSWSLIEVFLWTWSSYWDTLSSSGSEILDTIQTGTWETTSWSTIESTWVLVNTWSSYTWSETYIPEISSPIEPVNNTWSITDSWRVEIFHETWSLIPLELYYSDEDANSRIDTLEIIYLYELTGTVNTWSIFVYSRSWGLSEGRINTETGFILTGSLSGSSLILSLREWDLEKLELHITNSTTSDLRIKSVWDLGFRSIGWQIPESFFLTSSFDSYKNVIYKEYIYDIEEDIWTGEIIDSWSQIPPIIFPDIVPVLQSPTNAIFSSWGFECNESICRINITLEPIFSSGYSMKDYSCYFWTGDSVSLDADCNPNTYYFLSSGILDIQLVSKIDPTQKLERAFPIFWNPQWESLPTPWTNDLNPPEIILEFDGKQHFYYKQISEYDFECYTDTCAINLTAENSYDPEWSDIRFMWMYDMQDLTTKKDPGERKFWRWDHVIWLRVIDESENMSEVFFHIHVLGEKHKEEKIIPEKKSKWKKISQVLDSKKKIKKKKIKKFSFFNPPEIILQNKDSKNRKYQDLLCTTTTKTCGFNFVLSGTDKNITYTWKYDDGTEMMTKNPRSKALPQWNHMVILTASYQKSDTPLWEKTLNLQVKQIKSPKKPKKPKKASLKKPKAMKLSQKSLPEKQDITPFVFPWQKNSLPFELFYLLWGVGIVSMFRNKLFPKLSTFREQDADTES